MQPNKKELRVNAEVLTRDKVMVPDIAIQGKVEAKEVVEAIIKTVNNDDREAYAVRLLLPTAIDGALNIKSYSRSGRNLDLRKLHVNQMPDGASASLSISSDNGQSWKCAGVLANIELAYLIGKMWAEGQIEIELGKS